MNIKCNRGSAEILAFILILPFLLLPIFNTVNDIIKIAQYDVLRQVSKKAILQMEIEGGLSPEAHTEIIETLLAKNIDTSKVNIDYTPYPVAYGEDVRIRITYNFKDVSYTWGLGGLNKKVENIPLVYGPLASVSKKYQ